MESSTEFGKSLLADVRQRADKQSSDARKRAKKDAWKQLGVEVLIGAGKSLIANRQQEFLNNETNLANKMKIKTANDIATQVSQTEAAANGYEGGRDLFFQQKAKTAVDDYLQTQYPSGSYNETDYNMLSNTLSNTWGKELEKQHNEKYETTQKFLESSGGEGIEAYNKALKSQRGGNISGFVAEMIGRGTGILGTDSANVTANMLDSSEKVINFKKTYAKTGNVALSKFIADNKLLENVKLRKAAPKILKTVERTDAYGSTTHALAIISKDANGNPIPTYVNFQDNGKFSITNPDVSAEASTLSNQVSAVVSELRHPIKSKGQLILNGLSSEKSEIFADAIQKRIDDGNHANNSDEAKTIRQSEQNKYHSMAGVLSETLEKSGLFDSQTSNAVSSELIVSSIQNPDNNVLLTAGVSNPYHTLHALNTVVSEEAIRKPPSVINTLVRGNELNFLRSYRNETTEGRKNIDTILKDNDNFSFINVQNALSTVHSAVVEVVNNPRAYAELNDSQALKAAFDKLNMKKPESSKVTVKTEEPLTQEQIDLWLSKNKKNAKKIEGLSNNMINEAYGKEIKQYSNLIARQQKNTAAIKDFLSNDAERRAKLKSMTYAQREYYNKTGKFPDEL